MLTREHGFALRRHRPDAMANGGVAGSGALEGQSVRWSRGMAARREGGREGRRTRNARECGPLFDAPARNRTWNLRIKSPLLCQLSYKGVPRSVERSAG